MLCFRWLSCFAGSIVVALICNGVLAQSTQPSVSNANDAQLQVRANALMAGGDFRGALPMLEKIAVGLSDRPDDLGPIMEEIRVCKRQIKQATSAPSTSQPLMLSVLPAPTGLVDPKLAMGSDRTPHAAPVAGQILDIAIKELGNFEYDAEKGGGIPEDVKRLEGCHIRTRGFMVAPDQADNVTNFCLVASPTICCLGGPPQIQHTLVITCPKGKSVSFCPDAIVVEGTLHVSEQKDGDFVVSIFQIDATSVGPAEQ